MGISILIGEGLVWWDTKHSCGQWTSANMKDMLPYC